MTDRRHGKRRASTPRRARTGSAGKARKTRGRAKTKRWPFWRSVFVGLVVALLFGPPFVFLMYRFLPPPVTPLMLIRSSEGLDIDYRWAPLDRISPHLRHAVVAAEDNLFCEHWGFDFQQIMASLRESQSNGRRRGASTISMQTVKNLVLWPGRRLVRKVLEAWLTPQLELIAGKRRILELYLNIAEMGAGTYGAEAAARRYFGKPASDLTEKEAAAIAAVLPNPRRWSPDSPSGYLKTRTTAIRVRVGQLGPLLDCTR